MNTVSVRCVVACLVLLSSSPHEAVAQEASGTVYRRETIRSWFKGQRVTVSVGPQFAGAIDSLTWGGKEFINRHDTGRLLQSAVSFDGHGECYNPTEGGSGEDGGTTSSRLLRLSADGRTLRTESLMAYWARPARPPASCVRRGVTVANTSVLSDITLSKVVRIGVGRVANAIDHIVTFDLKKPYKTGVFEALTAYMPPEFSEFWTFDPATGTRRALSDGPGEQPLPVIFSTPGGRYAFGVFSAALPQADYKHNGYGRWRFSHLAGPDNATTKWNCVFRLTAIPAGRHTFRCTSVFGTLEDVERAITALHRTPVTTSEVLNGAVHWSR